MDTEASLVELHEPAPWGMGRWERQQRYYVENVFEELDEPGEWYLNRIAGTLYYYPFAGEKMADMEVIAPVVTSTLVHFDETGYQVRFVRGAGVKQARWREVEDAVAATVSGHNCVVLRLRDGRTTTIPVGVLAADAATFMDDLTPEQLTGKEPGSFHSVFGERFRPTEKFAEYDDLNEWGDGWSDPTPVRSLEGY